MAVLLGAMFAIVTTSISSAQKAVARSRNFYGILRVTQSEDPPNGPLRKLTHGLTLHGSQFLNSPQRTWPTSYYGPHSGIGTALNALRDHPRRGAVIGLGAGTNAPWCRPGCTLRFFQRHPHGFTLPIT